MHNHLLALSVILLVTACTPGAPSTGPGGTTGSHPRAGPTTLRSLMRVEPASLASKPLEGTGISIAHAQRLFNAELDMDDSREVTRPYLAEALPALNTDTWKVFPDGRMETTWRLRPNLVWHDATPLAAEDFVFAWRVYGSPDLGRAASRPTSQMEEVAARDSRTLVIRWNTPFPEAASLGRSFQALPRHVLEAPFRQSDPEAFTNHPFWNTQYVGLGPYRLERWEPGALIQGAAFDGHALGRPKIDRVVVRFIADENTVLTNLLAGEADFATDRSVRFEQAQILKREWGPTNGGTAILTPAQPRYLALQQRPEVANPRMLLDLRGRRAIAHAIDREALNLGLFDGDGAPTETFITRFFPAYQELDRVVTKYPYDPRRTEQLLGEIGYTKGPEGFFTLGGDRLTLGFLQEAGAQTDREMSIITDTWRRAGIDSQLSVMASTLLRDAQFRRSFPGVYSTATSAATKGGIQAVTSYRSPVVEGITPTSGNHGGWWNPDYDRLADAFLTTLDPAERNRQVIQMVKMLTEDVAIILLFFNYNVSVHSSAVRGPDPKAFDTLVNWNIHEWELR